MKNDLFSLEGKIAVVTGASRGLGRAIAVGFASAGADVVVTDILDTSKSIEKIKKYNHRAVGLKVDVSKQSDIESMVQQTINEFSRIDILVNNAGILRMGKAETLSEKDWDKVIKVNLKGQFLCAQIVGTQMIQQKKGGRIINIASIAGIGGYSQAIAYNASKAGVISLTKTLAVEWAQYNINVNAICPGVFATNMTGDFLENKEFKKNIKNNVPLGRHASPDEIVGTAIYLASKASDYVTGHSLVIDGGWTILL